MEFSAKFTKLGTYGNVLFTMNEANQGYDIAKKISAEIKKKFPDDYSPCYWVESKKKIYLQFSASAVIKEELETGAEYSLNFVSKTKKRASNGTRFLFLEIVSVTKTSEAFDASEELFDLLEI